ncbi:hypothetical protein AGMMS50268_27980 [Spirochaetia bacterium]|nr:hypothetical protein AGMMS50268_27980 [Spirochaetia bacterium]
MKGSSFLPILLILLIFPPPGAHLAAQQGNPGGAARRDGLPYLIPQTVFVGDKARLVVPLGTAFAGRGAFVQEDAAKLPRSGDIRVHRLELEQRGGGGAQLLIDFTAFMPGSLELPLIPELGISGLTVTIASILDSGGEGLVLSNPAPPLPPPGALFIIYGTVMGIIFLILAIIGGRVWSKRHLGVFLEKWRRRRLISLMKKVEARFRRSLINENSGDYRASLGLLSTEFRSFLGYFSGLNCRAMTAGEFFDFPPLLGWAGTGEYLGTLFRCFDRLRFSGEEIEKDDVLGILDGVKLFTDTLGQAVQTAPGVSQTAQKAPGTGARL